MEAYRKATSTVSEAINADNAGEYEKAYGLYVSALTQFMEIVKNEQNPQSKNVLLERMELYTTRAEKVKKLMTQSSTTKNDSQEVRERKSRRQDTCVIC